MEKAVTGYEQSQKSAEKFIALIDKYENFDTLTNTMLNEFVEKILVHERARKGSQDT
ncbi:site-specific recombinase, partial [human gut metagenome]